MSFSGRGLRFGSTVTWLSAVVVLCLAVPHMYGQANFGRILGAVQDKSGAAVAGATVTVTDVQRGTSRSLKTDDAGEYSAPDLVPGTYTVQAAARGFKTVQRPNLTVEVAKDLRVDFSLVPGDVSEVIEVQEEVPLVDTTSSTLGGTLSNTEINEIPLNGRNYENLLSVRPGITRYPGGGFSTLSTNGVRPEDNVFIMDGLNDDEPFSMQSMINGPPLFGDTTTVMPIDAIQEFNTIENPKAEYGWKPGAIVNVGLKSGTNSLHGTAYAFGRQDSWDANNPFIGSALPMNLQQFGATAGGPIKKDKLFFFGGYESQRYDAGSPFLLNTPVTTSIGDASASVVDACNAVGFANVNPLSAHLFDLQSDCSVGPNSFYPHNNGSSPSFAPKLTNTNHINSALGKIDYHLNERNLITGEYFFGQLNGVVNDAPSELARAWELQVHTRSQVTGLNWIWTPNTRWVNEARFGYSRFYQPSHTVDHNVPATTYGINTGITNPLYGGMPDIRIQGFAPLGNSFLKIQGPDQVAQFSDAVSYTVGKHAFKFGGEFRHDMITGAAYREAKGRVDFRDNCGACTQQFALENFLLGVPAHGQILLGDPLRHVHFEQFAGYVQDDFRASSRLTLNVGLRYELNTVLKEAKDQLANFYPNRGIVQVGHGVSSPYNGDHNNFAPRFGFAWDVTGSGKNVVRGGAGMAYEVLGANVFLLYANRMGLNTNPSGALIGPGGATPGGNINVATLTLPAGQINWSSAGPVFQTPTQIDCTPTTGTPCAVLGVNPNIRTPYVTNWNLGIQHAFTNNTSLDLSYVGNHGTKILGVRDINQVVPALDSGDFQSGRPFNTQFPYLSYINVLGNYAKSNYHSLQATLTQRNYHGLSMTAGYTYGHALDSSSSNWGLAPPQDSYNYAAEYASSDFDIRHRFTFTTSYALPGRDGFAQMLKGWQINSFLTLQTGQPWTVQDTGNGFSNTDEIDNPAWVYSGGERWNFNGNPSDFKPTAVGIPYFGPGLQDPTLPIDPTLAVNNPVCTAAANTPGLLASLQAGGCYVVGKSVMFPPALGTYGTMGRNLFRDTGFKNWDMSVSKVWTITERFHAQFRFELFNVLNHRNLANPYGAQNGFGAGAFNDPSTGAGSFGCGCATPDVAASNPVLGSGGPRKIQLGLKLSF